ncbi:MAG: HipA domain-containing protein, partial [Bacteroidales bacterium]|nr:HipA domain-containing protein [Bacteroidales bacterium]
ILSGCTDVDANLRELFRRVAFNICIGNSDDHFRNHGFLLTAKGWTLSPAYDMNPTLNDHQSLLINSNTNKADLSILLNSCEEYMLTPEVAKDIIIEVVTAVKDWRTLANRLGIAKREISLFEGVFDSRIALYYNQREDRIMNDL